MKITEELINKVEKAETLEEKKAIMKEAGIELSDEEVEQVVAGGTIEDIPSYQLIHPIFQQLYGPPLETHPVLTNPDTLPPEWDILKKLKNSSEQS